MLRAARALAGLKADDLAAFAEINATTVSRTEAAGHRPVRGQARTVSTRPHISIIVKFPLLNLMVISGVPGVQIS
jgi:hypothetical protein